MKIEPIIININNEPELLEMIVESVPYLPGWHLNSNITSNYNRKTTWWVNYPNKTPKFIGFYPKTRLISWASPDHSPPRRFLKTFTSEELSKFLEYIYAITIHNEKSS